MDNYISRHAALDAISDLYWVDERLLNFRKKIDAVFDKIKDLPSADVQPARRGDWLWDEYIGSMECSECGYMPIVETNYCPHCGAKMIDHEMENERKDDQ